MKEDHTVLDAEFSTGSTPHPEPRVIAAARHRVVAMVADGFIMLAAMLALHFMVNPLLAGMATAVFAAAYKVFMEYTFGATLGKKWIELEVVMANFGHANLRAILKRNIFVILNAVASVAANALFYQQLEGRWNNEMVLTLAAALSSVVWFYGLLCLVECLIMITDYQRRTLHDRIGGTLVVEQLPKATVSFK